MNIYERNLEGNTTVREKGVKLCSLPFTTLGSPSYWLSALPLLPTVLGDSAILFLLIIGGLNTRYWVASQRLRISLPLT